MSIRRLPLREAVAAVKGGPTLPIQGLTLRFVDKNASSGARQFLKEFAPRIAYANPLVPINVERIRDPRSKDLNPSAPDAGAQWDKQPEGELKVVLANGEQTIPLGSLTGAQIYESLLDVAK